MIVKVRTVDEGWLFFEADNVKTRPLTKEQYEFGISEGGLCVQVDVETLYKPISGKQSVHEIDVNVININYGKDRTLVYTNQPSYLLNNEGKTIETLVR